MKRGQFLASLFGAPVVAKDLTPEASADSGKPKLFALERPQFAPRLSGDGVKALHHALEKYKKKYNFDVIILQEGMTIKRIG